MSSPLLFSNPTNKAFKLLLYQTKNKQWSTIRLRQISSSSLSFNNNPKTLNESPNNNPKSRGGGGGSTGAKLVALTLAGFTVGIGYAVLNPDSRRQVESAIPQSSHLFNMIDGLLNSAPKSSSIEPPPKVQKKEENVSFNKAAPLEPLFKKPEEPSSATTKTTAKQASSSSSTAQKTTTPASSSQQKQTETTAAKTVETKQQETELDWKKTLKDFDLKEEAKIDAVENKLRTLNSTVKLRVSEALNSSYVAIESLNKYKQALRAALDESSDESLGKETQWRQVTDFFDIQTSDVNEANQKILIAKTTLDELDTMIKELKSIEFSKSVKNLRATQTDMIQQFRLLQAEQSKLSEAIVHANVLKSYTHEQKKARSQFLKEMQALQPEGIQAVNKSSGDQLSADELNSLLIHAHKRVIQLQKQLEKTQSTQNQQIQAALEEQRHQSQEAAKSHDAMLHDLHKKEFALDLEKSLEEQRALAAEELKKELARQAAAHNNHLAQMLRIQQEELNGLYEKRLIVETERIKSEFYAKVTDSLGRLKGIEHAMNARANLELQANNAKQLWLAVQNLGELIQSKADEINTNDKNADSELVSLKSSIEKIREAAPDNEFIQTVLASVPERVLSRGIWSEPDLKDRFQRLKTICNRVALIDDRGGSLFKYFISYVQSFFILHSKVDKSKLDEAAGKGPVSLDDLVLSSTFNILDYAEYYLKQDNLEYALRLMQQLKGEPRRLANDWISEALVLLEIKQACNLLTAYISSVYIGTKFK